MQEALHCNTVINESLTEMLNLGSGLHRLLENDRRCALGDAGRKEYRTDAVSYMIVQRRRIDKDDTGMFIISEVSKTDAHSIIILDRHAVSLKFGETVLCIRIRIVDNRRLSHIPLCIVLRHHQV